jgi:hypothetical protein
VRVREHDERIYTLPGCSQTVPGRSVLPGVLENGRARKIRGILRYEMRPTVDPTQSPAMGGNPAEFLELVALVLMRFRSSFMRAVLQAAVGAYARKGDVGRAPLFNEDPLSSPHSLIRALMCYWQHGPWHPSERCQGGHCLQYRP